MLRDIAVRSSQDITRLELCKLYAKGKYGGIPQHQAAAFTREFVQSATALDVQNLASSVELTHSMR